MIFQTYGKRFSGAFFAGVVLLALSACAGPKPPPLASVSDLEIGRYLGEWHQVAAIPAWFQQDCTGNTTANYSRGEEGLIRVVNSCDDRDGGRKQSEARARFLGEPNVGRLEVTFLEVFGFWVWPAAGDYWIVALDPDYHWSLVGEPGRRYAWILGREKTLELEKLKEIAAVLEAQAYDSCALLMTSGGQDGPLCDLVR